MENLKSGKRRLKRSVKGDQIKYLKLERDLNKAQDALIVLKVNLSKKQGNIAQNKIAKDPFYSVFYHADEEPKDD